MSKKSRRRNKKILAVLAAGLGAAALAKGKKGAVTGVVNPNAPKTDYITKKATQVASPIIDKVPIGRMAGAGTDEQKIVNQKKRADYAKQARIDALNTAEGPPSIDNPYRAPINPNRFSRKGGGIAKRGIGVALKSGGRVTGIAKRGFGRALMKGKK